MCSVLLFKLFFYQKEFSSNHMARPGGSVTQIIQVWNLCRKKTFIWLPFYLVLYCPQNVNIIPSHLHFVKQIVPIFNMTAVLYAHVKYSTFWYQNEYHTQFLAQQPISLLPAVILLCYIDISRFQHLAHQAFETIIIITSCQQNTTVNGK